MDIQICDVPHGFTGLLNKLTSCQCLKRHNSHATWLQWVESMLVSGEMDRDLVVRMWPLQHPRCNNVFVQITILVTGIPISIILAPLRISDQPEKIHLSHILYSMKHDSITYLDSFNDINWKMSIPSPRLHWSPKRSTWFCVFDIISHSLGKQVM